MPVRLAALCAVAATVALAGVAPARAHAADGKKAIWGPVRVAGVSQFPIYHELGVKTFQMGVSWAAVAPTRPAHPRDPADPAYHWPAEIDDAIGQAAIYHIRTLLEVNGAPPWANGGQPERFAPLRPADYADFVVAAARRYPSIHLWLIWGEPSKSENFQPLTPTVPGHRITAAQKRGPRLYARILDGAYGALKSVSRKNLVIGGNTWTVGAIPPLTWVRIMRLPNGRPPRMDLYGHNPFSARLPKLGGFPLGSGDADFSNLDRLSRAVDKNLARPRHKSRLRLFLSEFTVPTDHANWEFNFWVDRATQAKWLRAALRITRRWSTIYALGWLSLYDDPPRADGQQVDRGLIDAQGRRKPSFGVFARG